MLRLPKKGVLPKKEWMFCHFFHLFRNGKQAAIYAGYAPSLASQVAAKLLQRVDLRRKIAEFDHKRDQQKLQADVISGLQRMAFGSIGDAIKLMFAEQPDQSLDFDQLELFAISEIKRPKDGALEIKFFDRFKALVELARIADQSSEGQDVGALFRALEQSASALDEEPCDA